MKRAANTLDNEGTSKRVKVVKKDRINHATDCSDPQCEGCDVGEVELAFTNEDGSAAETPSALELFHMAMDEAATEGSKSDENGMAKKIFDLALEAYETEKNQDPLGYAQCLIEFGRYFDVIESVKEGVDNLRGLEKSSKKEESVVPMNELYIAKGRGILVQLNIERAKRIEIFEEIRDENSDEDDEIDPTVLKKLEVTKEEKKLINEAIQAFDKVFKAKTDDDYEKHILLCCNDLRQYGEQLDLPMHKETVNLVLTTAITYLKSLKDVESNAFALRIWGASLFYEARADIEADNAQQLVETALQKLLAAKNLETDDNDLETTELIGHCKMLLSTISTDEDEVLRHYQEAIDFFKAVVEQSNDSDPKLVELIEMLDGGVEEDSE
ncbi:hypothetical protein NQZ79_g3132 [Umbelopsis isabellina]|nr:hypothetical protein NQZ79_g3132 [Umbelopsis isabellina]